MTIEIKNDFVRVCFIIQRDDEYEISQTEMRRFVKKVNQFIAFREFQIQSATVAGLTEGWFTVLFNSESQKDKINDLIQILKNETPVGFVTTGCIVEELALVQNNMNVAQTKKLARFSTWGREMNEFELGYTPQNLKKLREKYNLTQSEVAKITNTKNRNSVSYWELNPATPSFHSMPHQKWLMLLNFLKSKKQ